MAGALVERVEISRSALVHNIREFRRLVGRKRIFLAVVKANAYGHGLVEASAIALAEGVDWLGVNSVEEGVALRDAGIDAPVLVLGYVPLGRPRRGGGPGPAPDRLQPGNGQAAGGAGRPLGPDGPPARQGGDRDVAAGRRPQGRRRLRPRHPETPGPRRRRAVVPLRQHRRHDQTRLSPPSARMLPVGLPGARGRAA